MLEDDLMNGFSEWAKANLWQMLEGETFSQPPLDVLTYATKPIRLSRFPLFGRGLAVVAMTRHPVDLKSDAAGLKTWIERLAKSVNGQCPPWKKLRPGAILMIAVQLTPEPIRGEDEEKFRPLLGLWTGTRVVPAGVVRMNLGQQAMASVMAEGLPRDLPDVGQLIDGWGSEFNRFVPMWSTTENI